MMGHFNSCTNLLELEVEADNVVYSSINGVLFSADQTKLMFYPPGRSGAYAVPMTGFGRRQFRLCREPVVGGQFACRPYQSGRIGF